MLKENTIKIFEKSFKDNWELPALTDYNTGSTMSYGDFARGIARLHVLYAQCGIKPGEKVALIGKNTPAWVGVFMATITYGAVIVPILQEFNPADVQHIINHSGATLLFASKSVWDALDFNGLLHVTAAISLDDMTLMAHKEDSPLGTELPRLDETFAQRYPQGFTTSDVCYPDIAGDEVMEINYTSGTTGYSKGVMVTGNNLCGNLVYGINSGLHSRGSRALSFLPLAHAYGCAFDMLVPLAVGSHIWLLGRLPSPKIIVKAMNEVKPNLVVTVPLVLEKIYSKMIVPTISRSMLRWAMAIPFLDNRIYAQIRNKLIEAFGGCFEEVIVGGAPFNQEVEDFLYKIKFPFTVGYGMTECAPLVSHTPWREFVPHSSGRVLPGLMDCKILSDDPENVPGEICVRGENVMKGYYHNTDATDKVLAPDGWLHTGDMGTLSADGTLFIRGRVKTMILSNNGQNIYPEEIEAKLNNMLYVNESLVVERTVGGAAAPEPEPETGRGLKGLKGLIRGGAGSAVKPAEQATAGKKVLVALVYPDYDAMDQLGLTREQLPELMESVRQEVNRLVAPYERIASVEVMESEFEKTPKRSIKRFLYEEKK